MPGLFPLAIGQMELQNVLLGSSTRNSSLLGFICLFWKYYALLGSLGLRALVVCAFRVYLEVHGTEKSPVNFFRVLITLVATTHEPPGSV